MEDKNIILNKVKMSLDTMRPYLQADGGDVEIVSLSDENVLSLKFLGSCSSCTQTSMTSASIEEAIKNYIKEIKEVVYVD